MRDRRISQLPADDLLGVGCAVARSQSAGGSLNFRLVLVSETGAALQVQNGLSIESDFDAGAVAFASIFLARAVLPDGPACTLHWSSPPTFRGAFRGIELMPDIFV